MLDTLVRLMALCALFLTVLLLASCKNAGPGIDACVWSDPIIVSRQDVLTDDTARQILAHNRKVRAFCAPETKPR